MQATYSYLQNGPSEVLSEKTDCKSAKFADVKDGIVTIKWDYGPKYEYENFSGYLPDNDCELKQIDGRVTTIRDKKELFALDLDKMVGPMTDARGVVEAKSKKRCVLILSKSESSVVLKRYVPK